MTEDGDVSQGRRPRPQLSDEVASYIRELIMSGRLRPGEFVRQERIAEELGLSATPVREGLRALTGEGFVELLPRRGFVVVSLSPDDIRDLFTAQELLAGELIRRAAARIGDDDLRGLRQVQEDVRKVVAGGGDRSEVQRLHHDFHRRINLIAGAPRLAWMLSISTKFAPRRFFASIPEWNTASANDHDAIIEALSQRDGEQARLAMMRHMENAGELLAANFEAAQASAPAS